MSSDPRRLGLCALVIVTAACADVRRGERWDEPGADEAEGGAAEAGAAEADDDGGPVPGATGDDGGDDGATGTVGGGTTGGAPAISFADEVHGILDAGCARCHAADGQASDTSFVLTGDVAADYDETLAFVNVGAPADSRLLAKGAGSGHIGGVIYDEQSTEYATILAWIEQGAMP